MDNQILTFILDTVKSIDSKVDNLVTKEECNNKQSNCNFKSKNELNIKKITAIGVIITGILAIIYKV